LPKTPPVPIFQILGPVSSQPHPSPPPTQQSSLSSFSTSQCWDSYQEKYISENEVYSEEAIDRNDTLKLQAFGEDSGIYLGDKEESESILSGFEPQKFKRGPVEGFKLVASSSSEEDQVDLSKLNPIQTVILLKFNGGIHLNVSFFANVVMNQFFLIFLKKYKLFGKFKKGFPKIASFQSCVPKRRFSLT
jgi:hypothetical protein